MTEKIKSIKFRDSKTEIKFITSEQPRGFNEIVEEKDVKVSDKTRHSDFDKAMEVLAPHILIRCEFATTIDRIDRPIDREWFNGGHWEDDNRFEGLEMVGIIIQGKDVIDGVQLLGRKVMTDGGVVEMKTPSISLYETTEAYNYPLTDILRDQVGTLLIEAKEWLKGKQGGAKQIEMEFPKSKLINMGVDPHDDEQSDSDWLKEKKLLHGIK